MHILIVDDEINIRGLIRKYAIFEGYQVAEAANGLEAIEKHGPLKGGILALWRILRCNPFSHGGYDPVP